MDCRNTRRQFDTLLLGDLANERKEALKAHLQKCTSCQQQWQEFQQFVTLVQGSLRTIPPPQAMVPVSLSTTPRPRNRVFRVLAMATAGILLLVFAALPLRLTPMPGFPQASSGIPAQSMIALDSSQSVSPIQTQGSWYIAFH